LSGRADVPPIGSYVGGKWGEGGAPVIRAAEHVSGAGTLVFDGARRHEGVTPDLDRHCARVNHSAEVMGMNPILSGDEIERIALEGIKRFRPDASIYIRPMYGSTERGPGFISPEPDSTAFALCLEEVPMPPTEATVTLTTTSFRRPTLETNTVNAKAACLYPNNARMMREAIAKGFSNALVCDQNGNVAETATANVFLAKDGEVFTPVPNGTFLNGITRQRHIALLRAAGQTVHETTLTLDDFRNADEVFLTGNLTKVSPVTAFDDVNYQVGPVARQAKELYWDWAKSG